MRGNVHVRFGGRGRRNGVREIEPPRSAPTLLKQLPKRSGKCLFEIILRRYETKSTMMTSNRPLEDWGKLLGDLPVATAILDRFLHHAEIITSTGCSYRLKDKAAKDPDPSKEQTNDEQDKD